MVDAWPAGLPQIFLVDGYSRGPQGNLLESQPDAGPPKTRRRSTATARPLSLSFICSASQVEDLEEFVETTLIGGSLPFNLPDQRSGGTLLVKFKKDGKPHESAHSAGGDNFVMQMDLWILP